jgi:hypothetical protein
MVMFSSFVSGVTNTVNAIRELQAHRANTDAMVLSFIKDHAIPLDLVRMIKHYVNLYFAARRNQRTLEQDISIFGDFPRQLRAEVRAVVYNRPLQTLAPFRIFSEADDNASRLICDRAMCETEYMDSLEIFAEHTIADRLHYIDSGFAVYTEAQLGPNEVASCTLDNLVRVITPEKEIGDDTWLAELALWVEQWRHRGSLVAVGTLHCITLDHKEVHKIIATSCIEYRQCLAKFAAYRCRMVQFAIHHSIEPNDLSDDELIWHDLSRIEAHERLGTMEEDSEWRTSQEFICRRIHEIIYLSGVSGLNRISHNDIRVSEVRFSRI